MSNTLLILALLAFLLSFIKDINFSKLKLSKAAQLRWLGTFTALLFVCSVGLGSFVNRGLPEGQFHWATLPLMTLDAGLLIASLVSWVTSTEI